MSNKCKARQYDWEKISKRFNPRFFISYSEEILESGMALNLLEKDKDKSFSYVLTKEGMCRFLQVLELSHGRLNSHLALQMVLAGVEPKTIVQTLPTLEVTKDKFKNSRVYAPERNLSLLTHSGLSPAPYVITRLRDVFGINTSDKYDVYNCEMNGLGHLCLRPLDFAPPTDYREFRRVYFSQSIICLAFLKQTLDRRDSILNHPIAKDILIRRSFKMTVPSERALTKEDFMREQAELVFEDYYQMSKSDMSEWSNGKHIASTHARIRTITDVVYENRTLYGSNDVIARLEVAQMALTAIGLYIYHTPTVMHTSVKKGLRGFLNKTNSLYKKYLISVRQGISPEDSREACKVMLEDYISSHTDGGWKVTTRLDWPSNPDQTTAKSKSESQAITTSTDELMTLLQGKEDK